MKKSAVFILLLLVSSFLTTTCKKGENDPVFSLLPRKTRLVGNWKMNKGYASYTRLSEAKSAVSYYLDFDGSHYKGTETPIGGTAYLYNGSYSLNLNFMKDGSFTIEEKWDSSNLSASGNWNFTSGVGKSKNKDGIIMIITSVSKDASNDHLFNKFQVEFTYKINELRNKEIILESGTPIYLNSNGDSDSFQNSYTFRQ